MKLKKTTQQIITLLLILYCQAIVAEALLTAEEEAFLQNHWSDTIPLQGKPPADYSDLESSLDPKSCGTCHVQQYQDWQTTLHAKAMGPGVSGQLVELVDSDPETAQMCWTCHTPLAEQQDKLQTGNSWQTNKVFDKQLQHQGLICAACHVRQHQRLGPPRKTQPHQTGKVSGNLPHNGFTAASAFTKSAFCKGCHQFNETDYALNGKLIENTYNEWLQSDYPAKGVQCQSCHMPERRHLWRGIHDEEMVKSGVTITLDVPRKQYQAGDTLNAKIRVTNSGVGHNFPTYLTPKVMVQAYLLDTAGNVFEASIQEAMIGREATLDMSEELYDTRIPPAETLAISYTQTMPADNLYLRVEVTVLPDHFYTRFYQSMLSNGSAGRGTKLIQQALEESQQSSFSIFEKTVPLTTNTTGLPTAKVGLKSETNTTSGTHSNTPDWNEANIKWFNYESGLKQAQQSGKPILLLFYADWCPTCHAYKHIFADERIVEQAQSLVMVRINVDHAPELATRYAPDGEYVPRVFALNTLGKQFSDLFEKRSYPQHFIGATDTNSFLGLMTTMVAH